MNARERWQALQARLTAARAFADAGDRKGALKEIDAALSLDPNFLAALSLRDRILSEPAAIPSATRTAPVAAAPLSAPISPAPAAATDGYAQFEQRARRRRVDRKVDAARTAIARRRLKDAAAALDEIIELDSNLPELPALTAQFDDLRRTTASPRRGQWLVAAASFAGIILGATWLEHARPASSLAAHQTTTVVTLPEPPAPAPVPSDVQPATPGDGVPETPVVVEPTPVAIAAPPSTPPPPVAATTGIREPERIRPTVVAERERSTRPVEASPDVSARTAESPSPEPRVPTTAPAAIETLPAPPPRAAAEPMTIPPVAQPNAANAIAPGNVVRSANDEQLVKQALQRYRSAYEGLDAPSARAVYPAVNEAALARAFDGLQSQTLTFDDCDVQVHGDSANASCHGTARYVPKVGSREPRIEPRRWTFILRRAGTDWKIDTARAER